MERQITISLDEYNKLIDMHTRREELPEKIEVKKFTSKWWKWLKRASYSLFHYNKNVEQQKLIKRSINEKSSVLLDNLYGYWRGDLSDYLKDRGNLEYSMRGYKDDAYRCVMEWLDKKKQRMENNMFEDVVDEGNIVVIDNDWIVLCKRWRPECYNLFCYLYLHKEYKNLMVGSHFTMTEDKKKSTRLATNEERLMLFEEMFKYGIAFDKHDHHLIGKLW